MLLNSRTFEDFQGPRQTPAALYESTTQIQIHQADIKEATRTLDRCRKHCWPLWVWTVPFVTVTAPPQNRSQVDCNLGNRLVQPDDQRSLHPSESAAESLAHQLLHIHTTATLYIYFQQRRGNIGYIHQQQHTCCSKQDNSILTVEHRPPGWSLSLNSEPTSNISHKPRSRLSMLSVRLEVTIPAVWHHCL